MTQILELQFETASGKTTTVAIDAPKPNITAVELRNVMQTIIEKNVFEGQAGALVAINSARIIDRQVTEFDFKMN